MKVKFGLSEEQIKALTKEQYAIKLAEVNFLRKEEKRQLKDAFMNALSEILEAL